jgi:hypothetical protein
MSTTQQPETNMTETRQTTTIEHTTGYHADGTPYVRLMTTITTDARDLGWDGETDYDWWVALVADLHAAEVALASLSPEQRAAAMQRLADASVDTLDLVDQPAAMQRAITETEAEATHA